MVVCVVVDDIMGISGHFEWASMQMRNIFPRKGPAKSICTLSQGNSGSIHGFDDATGSSDL